MSAITMTSEADSDTCCPRCLAGRYRSVSPSGVIEGAVTDALALLCALEFVANSFVPDDVDTAEAIASIRYNVRDKLLEIDEARKEIERRAKP